MTVQSLKRSLCATCGRTCYEQGGSMSIEAARTGDGREPVEEYLQKLETAPGRRRAKLDKLATIAIVFETFVHGELAQPRELNFLDDGIWEIKAGKCRLPFFYFEDGRHDRVARITSGFEKKQDKTPKGEIRKSKWVRQQDSLWRREIEGWS